MIPALIATMLLALVHVYGVRLTFSPSIPRNQWLSVAGGTGVAFVFVHVLPELSQGQEAVESSPFFVLGFLEQHVYLVALAGLIAFYGVEIAVKAHADALDTKEDTSGHHVFWVHIGLFAVYNGVIGYLTLHRETTGMVGLVAFAIAMMLHFVVNDHALRHQYRSAYHDRGRWLLAASVLIGWTVGVFVDVSEAMIGVLYAFVAGGLILNVLKEELPRERQSKFWAFALGALIYSGLLIFV